MAGRELATRGGSAVGRPNEGPGQVRIDDARIIFRNFQGLEGQYNRAGDRNFGVVLPPDIAAVMEEDGWNIKYLRPREEGDPPTPWVQVAVSFKGRPPKLTMVTHRVDPKTREVIPQRVLLPEPTPELDLVGMLDFVDIAKVDLMLNPYQWAVSGKSGVKAYLKTLFLTVQQDELERDYAHIEEVDISGKQIQQLTASAHEDDEIVIEEEDIIDEEEEA